MSVILVAKYLNKKLKLLNIKVSTSVSLKKFNQKHATRGKNRKHAQEIAMHFLS